MANTPDIPSCTAAPAVDNPQAPYYSLRYHFGMLLGVMDFDTEQAYHRGKVRLHNAWLHREGVVWGYDVRRDDQRGEIRVLPGLALDALGRELHLDQDACVNVAAWFAARRRDPGFAFEETPEQIRFDAHVLLLFKACLTRQVPAISEPCEGAPGGTQYSRVFETVEILLRPGPPPPSPPLPYHRLRLMFGLDDPVVKDGKIVEADQAVLDAPPNLESFRRFAALDEIDLRPPEDRKEFPVVLAALRGLTLKKAGESLTLAGGDVHVAVRPSHVATSAIQELLAGAFGSGGGPVILPSSFRLDEATKSISFTASADLAPSSVGKDAFSLSFFDPAAGWQNRNLTNPAYDAPTRAVTMKYTGNLGGTLVLFIAKGSGPAPLLGANLAPLNNGRDFVHRQKRS
jgi:hypothetical protein